MKKYLTPLLILCCSSAMASAQLPGCSKSADIDGQGTHQFFGDNGWIFESWEFKDDYTLSPKASDSLTRLNEALEARGSHLILVPTPFRSVPYAAAINRSGTPVADFSIQRYTANWNKMIADVKNTGVHVIDLLPAVKNFNGSPRGEAFYYPRDHHWTTSGAEVAARAVADQIQQISQQTGLSLQKEENEISFCKVELQGSFGERYQAACGIQPELMKRFDAAISRKNVSLLDTEETQIGIFGDSFGQAYPDNNFAALLEHQAQLVTANYSLSGAGVTLPMLSYFADEKVRAVLPPFIVVPFQGWVSNNDFDYDQSTAALVGCDAKRMISKADAAPPAPVATWIPNDQPTRLGRRILHVRTSVPTTYLEVRGNYSDGSPLSFESYRVSADYYKGSRTEFYAILPGEKSVGTVSVKIEGDRAFSMRTELCSLE